jgi:hypothetical protein
MEENRGNPGKRETARFYQQNQKFVSFATILHTPRQLKKWAGGCDRQVPGSALTLSNIFGFVWHSYPHPSSRPFKNLPASNYKKRWTTAMIMNKII